jgi:hypothetical protein
MMIKNKGGGDPRRSTGTKTEPVLDSIVNLPTYTDIKLDRKLAATAQELTADKYRMRCETGDDPSRGRQKT